MNKLTKVVLADDSPFVCSMLKNYLQSTTEFDVLGLAYNGLEALDLVKELRPDVVTLDLEMPKMNGLEVIEHVMYECPTPIVVISGISRNASKITLKALELGAVDFVLKYTPGIEINPAYLQADIVSKVKGASNISVIRSLKSQENLNSISDTKLYPFFDYSAKKKFPSSTHFPFSHDSMIEVLITLERRVSRRTRSTFSSATWRLRMSKLSPKYSWFATGVFSSVGAVLCRPLDVVCQGVQFWSL